MALILALERSKTSHPSRTTLCLSLLSLSLSQKFSPPTPPDSPDNHSAIAELSLDSRVQVCPISSVAFACLHRVVDPCAASRNNTFPPRPILHFPSVPIAITAAGSGRRPARREDGPPQPPHNSSSRCIWRCRHPAPTLRRLHQTVPFFVRPAGDAASSNRYLVTVARYPLSRAKCHRQHPRNARRMGANQLSAWDASGLARSRPVGEESRHPDLH